MDQPTSSSDSVLETLLKTNRPPTDQEKTIIHESMTLTNAKLKAVEEEISNAIAHIQALKSQVEREEITLLRLRKEQAAILKTYEDHRRVLSAIRYLPEDVLREICITCHVEGDIIIHSELSNDREIPLPYALAQISGGMRDIVLTTPIIWARMHVPYYLNSHRMGEQAYTILARRASEWFERAGRLPLTLSIFDPTAFTRLEEGESDPFNILFDALLSYSSRWKNIQFRSSGQFPPRSLIRIASLTAVDLPLLQSVSLDVACFFTSFKNCTTSFLTVPTLRHVSLETNNNRDFEINWAVLTSATLYSKWYKSNFSRNDLARIFQQAKRLTICKVWVSPYSMDDELPLEKITLPCLEDLLVDEGTFGSPSSRAPSLLDLITAPALTTLRICSAFLPLSLSGFLERSPSIGTVSLPYSNTDVSLADTTEFLRLCPSLSVLSLFPSNWQSRSTRPSHWDADALLRSFVQDGDVGVICPRLQWLRFTGDINFFLETLRLFLRGKQPKIYSPDIMPWKRVFIDIRGITDAETRQQMLDLLSQKKAEGLDVDTFST